MVQRLSIRLIFKSLAAAVSCIIMISAISLIGLRITGNQMLAVQTASMVPTFRPGDALIIRPTSPQNLKIGQIISYRSTRDTNLVISHRLVKINKQTGWLTTAGDAIHSNDPSFPPKLVIGRAIFLLPGFGRVLGFLHSWAGLVLLIYIPAGLAVAHEVNLLSRSYAQPFYSARL